MRTSRRIGGIVAGVVAAVTLGWSLPATGVTIVGGTPDQREMARWAIARFEAEGLTLPRLEIRFQTSRDSCRGHLAYYHDGIADMCGAHTDLMAGRSLLHEMSHGWLERNVTGTERDRFIELRGLKTWNDQNVVWDERGFEHGAEIMAWALGDQSDGILTPSIPDNDPDQLAAAFRQLTGTPLPELQNWMRWR
jgi:hypothetical protein